MEETGARMGRDGVEMGKGRGVSGKRMNVLLRAKNNQENDGGSRACKALLAESSSICRRSECLMGTHPVP